MDFNFQKTRIYKSVSISRFFGLGSPRFWRIVFLISGGLFFIIFAVLTILQKNNLIQSIPQTIRSANLFLGWAYILLPLGFSALFLEIFYNFYLKRPKIKEDESDILEFLDFDAASVLSGALSISQTLREPAATTNSLLLALTRYRPAAHVFIRLGVDPIQLKSILEQTFGSARDTLNPLRLFANVEFADDLANLIIEANNSRLVHKGDGITILDFLAALFDINPSFQKIMIDAGLDKNDLSSLAVWYEENARFHENLKSFWQLENLLRKPPIGVGWIYGHPWFLSHYATNLSEKFQRGLLDIKLIGRKRVVDQIEQVLSRAGENNVLLVGEPGVGKRTIILGFTQMIAEGKALPALNYKLVFDLNIPLITSAAKDPAEIQNILIAVLNEAAKAGNIILVIDDFHNFIGAFGGMGRTDISGILIPYFESSDIQVIVTTDPANFHKHIEGRGEIMKVFEKVEVEESGFAETQKIIQELVPALEAKNKILLTYGAIKNIVDSADRYIQTAPFPEKAIDLLTEVVSHAKSRKKAIVMPQDVLEVVTQKTEIPLGAVSGGEKEKLINLETELHQEIVAQDEAVKAITQTMQRLRVGLGRRGKPAGVFLFVGPTGVGKTLTAKALAKIYFGSKDKMIRFDMSEYQDVESLDRFLGNLRINEPGQLASKVRDKPFSMILLDELEKTYKNILNIFLAVFDEGQMTDVFGRKINFEQNIIIATSNAAADLIRDMVNQGIDPSAQKERIIDALVKGRYFSPEFLNRFDEIVIFHPLNQEHVRKIAEMLLGGLAERMREQDYLFKPTSELADYIAQVGFDPQFGARPMQRVIQDRIESLVARKILEGTVRKGEEFSLALNDIS